MISDILLEKFTFVIMIGPNSVTCSLSVFGYIEFFNIVCIN